MGLFIWNYGSRAGPLNETEMLAGLEIIYIGSFQKRSIPPHRGNRKLTPLPPSDVLLIHLLFQNHPQRYEKLVSYYQKQFFLPSGQQKFPPWGEYGCFLERPIALNGPFAL
jgi:hypothetical protein